MPRSRRAREPRPSVPRRESSLPPPGRGVAVPPPSRSGRPTSGRAARAGPRAPPPSKRDQSRPSSPADAMAAGTGVGSAAAMTLQARTLLLVAVLVLFAVVATAVPLTFVSRDRLLDETRQAASRLAGVLARSAAYSDRSWRDVERAIGKQMVVQASLTAQFVAAAERAGMSPGEINARLRGVTRRTTIDEFWLTDPTGHAYLHSVPGIDFTFSPDPREEPQASAFWPLLKGQRKTVIQQAQRREVDDKVFKYVGVGGVDEPRIVQVGYEARYLAALRRQVGLVQLVEQTAGSPGVVGIRVINSRLRTRVFRSGPDAPEDAPLNARERAALGGALQREEPQTFEEGDVLSVAAPIRSRRSGGVIGGV